VDTTTRLIEVERQGDTLILTPCRDLRELDFQKIEAERDEVLACVEHDPSIRNVVVDFGKIDYVGSTALGMMARLWQQARARSGRMILCNVSAHEREVLDVTHLGGLWPVYGTRQEALAALSRSVTAA
jgi:anti-anti-sigma factor